MLLVTLENARPGMTLALPVPNPAAPERHLLRRGYALGGREIARLQTLGVGEIWVRYPGLDEIAKYIDPEVRQEQQQLATRLLTAFEGAQERSCPQVPYQRYVEAMGKLIQSMLQNPSANVFLMQASAQHASLVERSAAVAHLSLLMGMRLRDHIALERSGLNRRAATNLTNLGLGAMLHDIGILGLEPEVCERFERTGDTDDPEWREHVTIGHEIIGGQVAPSAAVVVRDHHQRCDGTGFPSRPCEAGGRRAPRRRDIHVFARVVAVAETFMRFCRPRQGEQVPAVRAIGRLIAPPCVAGFDPTVVRAFLSVTPPYPPGRIVRLSDGRWAVPLRHDPRDPCRPTVQIVEEPDLLGAVSPDEPDQEVVNLREAADLRVATAGGVDVLDANFAPPVLAPVAPAA